MESILNQGRFEKLIWTQGLPSLYRVSGEGPWKAKASSEILITSHIKCHLVHKNIVVLASVMVSSSCDGDSRSWDGDSSSCDVIVVDVMVIVVVVIVIVAYVMMKVVVVMIIVVDVS